MTQPPTPVPAEVIEGREAWTGRRRVMQSIVEGFRRVRGGVYAGNVIRGGVNWAEYGFEGSPAAVAVTCDECSLARDQVTRVFRALIGVEAMIKMSPLDRPRGSASTIDDAEIDLLVSDVLDVVEGLRAETYEHEAGIAVSSNVVTRVIMDQPVREVSDGDLGIQGVWTGFRVEF